jgi:putative endopeptidase
VGQPEFYKALDKVVAGADTQVLKDYLAFHFASTFAPYLSRPFVDAHFNFYYRALRGAQEQRPRWKRVLDAEERAIGEALGQLFVKEYFNEKAKARYSEMVERIRDAYKLRIEKLDWMSDSTKQKALHKLATMKKKVGYPDNWKDFSAMKIGRSSFAENMMHANEWWNAYYIAKLGKPVDRTEWEMTPQTYNAYYNPSNNEIVLPAGIFTVPGYRDEELDDALVYGYAAASTIGHEITHGFDDEGRKFDEKGNLQNWWSPGDSAQFAKRSEVLVRQFNGMIAVDTIHLNGRASLGENLADLGGLLLGVDAFKQTDVYKKGEKISGLTPLQRFFFGYALGWMYQIRDEQLASQVITDVHAPAKFRVNGPLPNVPAFYEAFVVKPGDKMYLPDSARVHLW